MNDLIKIKSIWQKNDSTLAIEWSDDKTLEFDVVDLRCKCPCASCVDEMTGRRSLKPESIPKTVRPRSIQSIGRYALGISFSDGHKTGIYTFDYLRNLNLSS